MSKEQSTIIKGIAILMMLWYHLFGITELEKMCHPLIYIKGEALVAYLARACYPVSFFLILSGYGLTYVYKSCRLNMQSQSKRLMKLYIHYWVIMAIFVTIGHFILPERYPNDFFHILANITGFHCTWNGETWFLLPYSFICLTSVYIIPYLYHIQKWRIILFTAIIYAILFLTGRHFASQIQDNRFTNLLILQLHYYISLSFYFFLGIILYRLKEKNMLFMGQRQYVYIGILLCIVIIKSLFKITLADGFYALAVIILLLNIKMPKGMMTVLHELGHRSMPMWMTHTFFAVYLFPDFIYGFKYPLLIFFVLVVTTYMTAIPLMWICQRIIKYIRI